MALFGILGIRLDGKLSMLLGFGIDGMNPVDSIGIGTIDGHEHGAIERSGDGWIVYACAERHSVRMQAQGSGQGCVIEMAVGTNVELGRRLGECLRSPARSGEPLLRREPPIDFKLSQLDGPPGLLVEDARPVPG